MHINRVFGLSALLCLGCVDDPTPQADPPPATLDAGIDADLTPADDASVDAEIDAEIDAAISDFGLDLPDAMPPPVPAMSWCARQAPAFDDGRSASLGWSEAHALARFFGPHDSLTTVDDALTKALDNASPRSAYSVFLPFVCATDIAQPTPAPGSQVDQRDGIAFVRPGAGALDLPAEARAVVLDLRGLASVQGLREILNASAAAVLSAPIERSMRVRQVTGLPDQVFTDQSPYRVRPHVLNEEAWPGTGRARPLVVLVDPVMPPAVAELAGAIRVAGRGWLVGASVYSGVAESRRIAVNDGGLAVRIGTRMSDMTAWPDVIAADADRLDDLDPAWMDGEPPPAVMGAVARPRVEEIAVFQQVPDRSFSAGAYAAMLLISHGAMRRFFPYFDVVGDRIDARLIEVLESMPEPPTRGAARMALSRFSEAIADGHAFIFDLVERSPQTAPFMVDHLADERPVIRRSIDPSILAGEVITQIEGQPVADWYATELARTSAASRGYALALASVRFMDGDGPLSLQVEALDGVLRDILVDRVPAAARLVGSPWQHPSGFLDAFDADDILYVNLGDDVETDAADLVARLVQQMPNAQGIVVDMRGYPRLDHYRVALTLVGGEGFESPIFELPVWTGPDVLTIDSQQYTGRDLGGQNTVGFAGPIALLVGPTSVSAAENFSMMLTPFEQVTVIGRASAATNGNITGMWLPGGFGLTFTGMAVYFTDGGLFHGVGIVPDIEVWPTPASLANGTDLALLRAIDHVRAQQP